MSLRAAVPVATIRTAPSRWNSGQADALWELPSDSFKVRYALDSAKETMMAKTPITNINGIGPAAAALLADAGFTSVEDVSRAKPEQIAAIRGFGPVRASKLIAAAQGMVGSSRLSESRPARSKAAPAEAPAKPKKSSDKKSKKKKDRKGKKDKKDKKGGKKDKKKKKRKKK